MRSLYLILNMIFEFFKRLFGLVDEGSRKRRAVDIDDVCSTSIVGPKKYRCESLRTGRLICADENADEEIEYLGDRTLLRNKERLNGNSCARRKLSCQQTNTNDCRKKSQSLRNNDNERDKIFTATMSNSNARYSTLSRTNRLREKQEYSQLLQCFLPQKGQTTRDKIRQDEAKKCQVTEVIDLEKYETPTKRDPENQKREIFSTPSTSTPLKWYTPRETKNREIPMKNDDVSILSIKKTSDFRNRDGEISILKSRLPNERIVPIVRIDQTKESPKMTIFDRPEPKNYVEMIRSNTLRDSLAAKAVIKQDFVPRISDHYNERFENRRKEAEELKRVTCLLSKHNRLTREAALEEQLTRSMRLCEAVLHETEELEDEALPELTSSMLKEIKQALIPNPPNEVIIENFGLRITRKDINTLSGLNWLNDEVINFYMNLLIVRGTNSDKYPRVHAMNTFFYPKLLSGGHASLKRWTRKIDIFAQDILVVPIHLGIHWCMSIVDFRDKQIRYYDSMGGANPKCLITLKQYLEDESMDKKKKPFDTNDWKLESMVDIPQQMNGSDCGVFSCMFAEFITANRKITFTQQDMPYFRNKMVYEIIKAKLL